MQDELLRAMFGAAIAAAQPRLCVPPHLPARPRGRLVVIGAGKAAAMAQTVEAHYQGGVSGLVVTKYGHALPTQWIEVAQAAHPVPDAAGMAAAARMLALVAGLTRDDLVICLLSGGASALLPLPFPGLSLADKQQLSRALLISGATIREMNLVRRHISAIKGGRLAAACGAPMINLIISDVPGDDPVDIGSGPTVIDPTHCADALDILNRYDIAMPAVRDLLAGGRSETVKAGLNVQTKIIATPQMALEAAAKVARAAGYGVHILGDAIEGAAREFGTVMAGMARQVALRDQPFARPCVILSGGETTVQVTGQGIGGRNVEFLLSLALGLDGMPGVSALAGDTDGVDGGAPVAGAVLRPDSLARARNLGLSARDYLTRNDAHSFFAALGDGVITGPTQTNVNDFRAVLVAKA